ncbi:MAG: carbonic anhydrase [Melioribacteraceae bacterium]|nr:carbonic anhydrase [Melioribacteraceae bacterium]
MRGIICFLGLLLFVTIHSQELSPDQALAKLKEGNNRFVANEVSFKDYVADIETTAGGQSPYAVIVTCSDSRVPPEILFDESIGKLFVIRLAGNIIDSAAVGSIEYAVKYLNSSYLLMLGHTHCGAVHAVVGGGNYSPAITSIAKRIAPAFEKVKAMDIEEEKREESTIKENVLLQARAASDMSEIISEHRNNGTLKIGGAVYDIEDGRVHFFD